MTSTEANAAKAMHPILQRHYYRDLEKLLSFIVPPNAKVFRVHGEMPEVRDGECDYVVMPGTIAFTQDISVSLDRAHQALSDDGRLVLTYHNHLWRPLVAIAGKLRLKKRPHERAWLSDGDVRNFLNVSNFEIVRTGKRMLMPVYIPLISAALNWLGQLPLVNRLCLMTYIIARPIAGQRREYSVSIIVPARNEEGNVRAIVERMPRFGTTQEIIFVEGNSKDGTWKEIQRVAASYSGEMTVRAAQQDGRGKGDAVRKGFALASGEVLMIFDADVTVAPEDMVKFYEAMARQKADFINGSRLVYPVEDGAMRFLNMLGNTFFALFMSWLFGQRFKDVLCGTKVFRKADYERIAKNRSYFGDFDDFGDFDFLLGALRQNLKVIDLPVRYGRRGYGETQIRRFSHGWQLLKMCMYAAWKIKS